MQVATFSSPVLGAPLILNNIRGTRCSYCLIPRMGYQGQFYVYLFIRHSADEPLPPFLLAHNGVPVRGSLTIEGDFFANYTFPGIDLNAVRIRTNERQRLAIVEFRMAREMTDDPTKYQAPTLEFSGQTAPMNGHLGDHYKFTINEGPLENLLDFDALPSVVDTVPVRFQSFSTDRQHSFFHQGIETHGEWVTRRRKANAFKEFTINFSQKPLAVNVHNLERLYVEESSGALLHVDSPDLTEYITDNTHREFARVAMSLKPYSAGQSLEHAGNRNFTDGSDQRVIQTATFLFRGRTAADLVVV